MTTKQIEQLALEMTAKIQSGIEANLAAERLVFSISGYIEGKLLELSNNNPGVK